MKLHALATGRLYHVTFLSNSTFPYVFCLSELKKCWVMGLWTRVPARRTVAQCLCVPNYNESRRKNHIALGKASKWALCPKFFCSNQMSGVWCIL